MKEIKVENLTIRQFKESDAKQILENWEYLGQKKQKGDPNYNASYELIKMEINSANELAKTNHPLWAIVENDTDNLIGFISGCKGNLDEVSVCDISFHIENLSKNKQKLKIAVNAICDYLIYEEGFDIVASEVFTYRKKRAEIFISLLTEIGMKKDDVLLNRIVDEEIENVVLYSLDRNDLEVGCVV